jgi:hypothetical protein
LSKVALGGESQTTRGCAAWVTLALICAWALVMTALLAGSAGAETVGGCGPFRVEWNLGVLSPTDGKLEGFVYNESPCAVSDVRIHVTAVDPEGRPVGESRGWVHGDIPAGGRGYFVLGVPDGPGADSYRVNVIGFDPISTVP